MTDNAELDAKAAELMGWHREEVFVDYPDTDWVWHDLDGKPVRMFSPTTNAVHTERLMEFARSMKIPFTIDFQDKVTVTVHGSNLERRFIHKVKREPDWKVAITKAIVEALS